MRKLPWLRRMGERFLLLMLALLLADHLTSLISGNATSARLMRGAARGQDDKLAELCKASSLYKERSYVSIVVCTFYGRAAGDLETNSPRDMLDRADFLDLFQGLQEAGTGRYRESCQTISGIPAPPVLASFAWKAYERSDWQGLQAFLNCLDALPDRGGNYSHYQVAILFDRLGDHEAGSARWAAAAQAYLSAIEWYPAPWSEPVLGLAQVRAAQAGEDEAVKTLQFFFPNLESEDPKVMYDLSRQLALHWDRMGLLDQAACAYSLAVRLDPKLPESLAPAEWRQADRMRLQQIMDLGANLDDCTPGNLKTW